MTMDDELLSDILAAEREIRQRIDERQRQREERLAAVARELAQEWEREAGALRAEREQALDRTERRARQEAEGLVAEARAYAQRLERMETADLDRFLAPRLRGLLPEGGP